MDSVPNPALRFMMSKKLSVGQECLCAHGRRMCRLWGGGKVMVRGCAVCRGGLGREGVQVSGM